jgi:uncharacterized membrane protein YkvA (DUF1232 family)
MIESGIGAAVLGSCLQFVPEEGINFEKFVEEGGRLVALESRRDLGQAEPELRAKIDSLREAHPRLARQLEFFEKLLVWDTGRLPEKTRSEILFGLLYAIAEVDLVPDVFPEVGYTDDALVCEVILRRHTTSIHEFCAASGVDWAAVSAEISA